jgi:hypothetical protein
MPDQYRRDRGAAPAERIELPLDDGLDAYVDRATRAKAARIAARSGVTADEVLLAEGWIGREDHCRCLARRFGLDYLPRQALDDAASAGEGVRRSLAQGLLRLRRPGRVRWALAARAETLAQSETDVARLRAERVGLASAVSVREAIARSHARRLLAEAVSGLERRFPGESAAAGICAWQRAALAVGAGLTAGALLLAPALTLKLLVAALLAAFAPIVALRLYAALTVHARPKPRQPRAPDASLPVYTLLVPMFREADVLAGLVTALSRLDWPAAKLDIKLILEEADAETRAEAAALELPPQFEVIVVPDCTPRTKPKALNYALALARGDYVVIYDAEDRPHPAQLRRAFAKFEQGGPKLACVQARLGFYNAAENWMTRQFELEYAALFDGLLPALERLGVPIPLGGTSNHFRRSSLIWMGAWDAFNVTEDADLGMRLSRRGYECAMLDSTTAEEAPVTLRNWTPQRTRWLKGYMQTYAVHMRDPVRLCRELGFRRFAGFQVIFAGMILTALAHPVACALALWQVTRTGAFSPATIGDAGLLGAGCALALVGYGGAMLLALRAARSRGAKASPFLLLTMPVYWLMISAASYRALWQLRSRPHHWEKTAHGATRYARNEILTPR